MARQGGKPDWKEFKKWKRESGDKELGQLFQRVSLKGEQGNEVVVRGECGVQSVLLVGLRSVITACLNDDWNNPGERGKAVNAGQEYKCRQ